MLHHVAMYHPSNYYKYQFRGGSRTATITKTDYDKELPLGCCSGSRSASAIYMKSSFKKLHERSALICLTYFNVIPTMFAEEGDDDGGRREGGRPARIWSYIIEQ